MTPTLVTCTFEPLPPVPPLPPLPPRLTEAALSPPFAFDALDPPLPPPPPTDCAKIPLERSPAVSILAALLTKTSAPLPPLPPAPPMRSIAPAMRSNCSRWS
jgi:hypothetical protein